MLEDWCLSDTFFKERIEMEKQFFEFLKKSFNRRSSRISSINKNKEELTKLRTDTIEYNFFTNDVIDFKTKSESIEKLKSKIKYLEEALVFNDELVRDYSQDFENRRDSKDRKDFQQLLKDKKVFVNDITAAHRYLYRKKGELRSLNAAISEYYADYPERQKTNTDINELISQKKITQREITQKTNFILDCENKVKYIDIKMLFISPPPCRENKDVCGKEENLFAFFKLLHLKGSLNKTMNNVQIFLDQLKLKISEIDEKFRKFDKKYSIPNSYETDSDDFDKMVQLSDELVEEGDGLKRLANDHSLEFYGADAYAKKWTISNLKRCIQDIEDGKSHLCKNPILIDDDDDDKSEDQSPQSQNLKSFLGHHTLASNNSDARSNYEPVEHEHDTNNNDINNSNSDPRSIRSKIGYPVIKDDHYDSTPTKRAKF